MGNKSSRYVSHTELRFYLQRADEKISVLQEALEDSQNDYAKVTRELKQNLETLQEQNENQVNLCKSVSVCLIRFVKRGNIILGKGKVKITVLDGSG